MTEAPWNVAGRQKKNQIGGFFVIAAPGGVAIAYIAYDDDARLIAAAPELLDALLVAQEILARNGITRPEIVAALAKAKGMTQ
ncbi:MAG: hypothetical protein ABIH03_05455 [Pseudomonadota bacterium]